jgi:prepilin-type processing-associated H-X9-DG protein
MQNMKALLAVFAVLFLPIGQETKPDLSSPEATMKSFLAALGEANLVLAAKHLHAVEPSPRLGTLSTLMKGSIPRIALENIATTPSGENRVTLSAKVLSFMPSTKQVDEQSSKIDLIKVGDEWKIAVPQDANLESPDALTTMVCFVAYPDATLGKAKRAAQKAQCISNLKHIAMAAMMSAEEYDGKLKVTAANLQTKLAPYVKDQQIWRCPLDSFGTQSYSINGNIAGKNLLIDKPQETVMFYEGKNGALNYHHDGAALVAFLDGHVEAIKKEDAKKLIWIPKSL